MPKRNESRLSIGDQMSMAYVRDAYVEGSERVLWPQETERYVFKDCCGHGIASLQTRHP